MADRTVDTADGQNLHVNDNGDGIQFAVWSRSGHQIAYLTADEAQALANAINEVLAEQRSEVAA
jgi:hypothetical protein